jgi:hypothetical protein
MHVDTFCVDVDTPSDLSLPLASYHRGLGSCPGQSMWDL